MEIVGAAAVPLAAPGEVSRKDTEGETLTCRDCGQAFLFSVGEQEFFKSKGFQNKPSRCKTCKANAKRDRAERDGGGGGGGRGACYAFQKGRCDRGDSCRFSHDPNAPDGRKTVHRGGIRRGIDSRQSRREVERWKLRENTPLSDVQVWGPIDVEVSGYESDQSEAAAGEGGGVGGRKSEGKKTKKPRKKKSKKKKKKKK